MFALECWVCGDIAFRFKREPKMEEIVRGNNIVLSDGSTPADGERMVCGSCGSRIIEYNLGPEFLVSVDN